MAKTGALRDPPRTSQLLLVEGDSRVADAATMFLESLGHDVWRATNCVQALTLVAERGVPDLILSSLRLSGPLNGAQLVRRLRVEANFIIPAIIMTADSSSNGRAQVESVAPCGFFVKPFDCTTLTIAIDDLDM